MLIALSISSFRLARAPGPQGFGNIIDPVSPNIVRGRQFRLSLVVEERRVQWVGGVVDLDRD
jgi:hypothetical protein